MIDKHCPELDGEEPVVLMARTTSFYRSAQFSLLLTIICLLGSSIIFFVVIFYAKPNKKAMELQISFREERKRMIKELRKYSDYDD